MRDAKVPRTETSSARARRASTRLAPPASSASSAVIWPSRLPQLILPSVVASSLVLGGRMASATDAPASVCDGSFFLLHAPCAATRTRTAAALPKKSRALLLAHRPHIA